MKNRLNHKLLVRVLVGLAFACTTTHLVHAYQLRRNAPALVQQAERAAQKGRLERAATYLYDYLSYEPGNTEALARYGLTLDKLARTVKARERAAAILEQV